MLRLLVWASGSLTGSQERKGGRQAFTTPVLPQGLPSLRVCQLLPPSAPSALGGDSPCHQSWSAALCLVADVHPTLLCKIFPSALQSPKLSELCFSAKTQTHAQRRLFSRSLVSRKIAPADISHSFCPFLLPSLPHTPSVHLS